MSFIIRQLDSYAQVIELYKIVYPGKDVNKFEWLYYQNPNGKADIFAAIEDDSGKVIGTYVFIPMKIVIDGNISPIAQAIDGMVHPDYRGKRVFNRLVSEVFPKVSEKYQYLIGFPNNNSRGSLVKAGWVELGEFVTYSLPLTTTAITANQIGAVFAPFLFLYNTFHKSKYNRPDDTLVSQNEKPFHYETVLSTIHQKNRVMMYRDSQLIDWRLHKIPKENYQILRFQSEGTDEGYIAYKTNNNSAEIVDIVINPDDKKICSALSLFVAYCQKKLYNAIHIQLSNNTYCKDALRKLGFIKRKTNHAIIMYPTRGTLQKIDVTDCYISLADTDWL